MSKEVEASQGIGFFGVLCILFVGLKLTNYIAWPWVWVLSPLWLPLVIFICTAALFFIGLFIKEIIK